MGKAQTEALFAELDLLISRLECGQSFFSSIQDLKRLRTPAQWAQEWREISQQIQDSQCSGCVAVKEFRNKLRLRCELERKMRMASHSSRLQIQISTALYLLLAACNLLLFEAELSKMAPFLLGGLCLTALSLVVSRHLLKPFSILEERMEWLFLLRDLKFRMQLGNSFIASLERCLGHAPHLNLHYALGLSAILNDLKMGEIPSEGRGLDKLKHDSRQFANLLDALERGLQLSPMLESWAKRLRSELEEKIDQESTKLSFKMFVPLFCFQYPAYILVLLSSLFAQLG